MKLNNYSNRDTYYNIYNNYQNSSKTKKNDENKSIIENIYNDDNNDEIDNKELKSKINKYIDKSIKQTKIMKKEINSTIKKINNLYHEYQKNI